VEDVLGLPVLIDGRRDTRYRRCSDLRCSPFLTPPPSAAFPKGIFSRESGNAAEQERRPAGAQRIYYARGRSAEDCGIARDRKQND
jgi:hypothetical protein